MFNKILIANRGEIACRIMRTARHLGVRTVAVYSDADARARHVREADEAVAIGPPPAAESYLDGEAIIAAARDRGAEAIHPGYGFLAENADFAEACAAAGLVFVGPPAEAIRTMGSKSAAKELMETAGVPVVPGARGRGLSDAELAGHAPRIGFPVLIKPALGGGGKGMRRVDDAEDFAGALAASKREAQASFGDDEVLLEKFVTRARHVEVQVFADAHGNVVHLFDRDCTLQRRHQKIIEEAPAPGLSPALRERMAQAAVAAARAVGYVNAGTVEFIVDGEDFYFIEMNTRLQVEHPVTEMITGLDLVEWQLRVAAGETLPLRQGDIGAAGHAFEGRIYAEAPERGFLPSTGRLRRFRAPAGDETLRLDSGVGEGDIVGPHYDPMIAKLIVRGADRADALRRLRAALSQFEVRGVSTNIAFLLAAASNKAFADARIDTEWLDREGGRVIPGSAPPSSEAIAVVALYALRERPGRPWHARRTNGSPWEAARAWRLNGPAREELLLHDGSLDTLVGVEHADSGVRLTIDGEGDLAVTGGGNLRGGGDVTLEGQVIEAIVYPEEAVLTVILAGEAARLQLVDPVAMAAAQDLGGGAVTSPMPGKVVQIIGVRGAEVKRGAPLMVVEAMKMEHTIAAPSDGTVTAFHYKIGDFVEEGAVLLDFDLDEES